MGYGFLIAELEYPFWDRIINRIEKKDLTDKRDWSPLETNPHVTLFANLVDKKMDKRKLAEHVMKFISKPPKLEIHSISIFNNPDWKVLKLDVSHPILYEMHDFIRENYDNEQTFPNYVPHSTIAYLKKEVDHEKYYDIIDGKHQPTIKRIYYSDPNRKHYYLVDYDNKNRLIVI